MRKHMLAAVGGASVLASAELARRYRRDCAAASARLAAIGRTMLPAAFGTIEFAERGTGEPVLALHGIFGGCDAALQNIDGLFAGRRVIAPSRFGYLGSSLPPAATPAGQADAYATLLAQLGIGRTDVVAFSAGTTSALQLALRHPDRVGHLVVMSGNWPGSRTASPQPQANRLLLHSEFPMWALATFARPLLARLAGVPAGLPLTAADRRWLAGLIGTMFPVVPRADGISFDFFVSNPDVNNYRLEAVTAPTLIVHARDDPLISYDVARRAAVRIPRARLVSVSSGGHPMLGQEQAHLAAITAFLNEPVPAGTGSVTGR